MDGNFGRRKREDQPTTARVYVMQPKHFLEECSVRLRVMAVDDCVSPIDHFTHLLTSSRPPKAAIGKCAPKRISRVYGQIEWRLLHFAQ
jgi:hypothetical protein